MYILQRSRYIYYLSFFFFNDTATTEIYTLSLHDALPISHHLERARQDHRRDPAVLGSEAGRGDPPDQHHQRHRSRAEDRKSTRLNSSHANISYAVFCLKKKNDLNLRLYYHFISTIRLYAD